MIKVSGCCDGCGAKASFDNIKSFIRINTFEDAKPRSFDLCDLCINELLHIKGATTTSQIGELKEHHACRRKA